ncbi:MAG: LUD domain-containing protein [Chitinophagaceae bacterium]
MSAREDILKAVAANQPSSKLLPVVDISAVIAYDDVIKQFTTVLESIGGKVISIPDLQSVKEEMATGTQQGKVMVNAIPELGTIDQTLAEATAHQLAAVDTFFTKGIIGVAENGSVWVAESNMLNRLLPFICQHLVLLVEKKNIVATMHHAYQQVDTFSEGFGAFIAGPSKTADIEQSLVIGAHGARSLVVYLL